MFPCSSRFGPDQASVLAVLLGDDRHRSGANAAFLVGDPLAHHGFDASRAFFGQRFEHMLSDDLIGPEAAHPLVGRADVGQAAVAVHVPDDVGRVLREHPEMRFTLTDLVLGGAQGGDLLA